jgi:hypothetical protein
MRVKLYAGEHYAVGFADTPKGPKTGPPEVQATDAGNKLLVNTFGFRRSQVTMTWNGDRTDKREHIIFETR